MSQWTSKHAISRDLSAAQGLVPVAISRIVGADDKPPALDIKEETEEEFFRHGTGDRDSNTAPDLGLIKQMLEIVREIDVASYEDNIENIVISKLNSSPSTIMPSDNLIENHNNTDVVAASKNVKPKKKIRNVALESILKAIEDNNVQPDDHKPVDYTLNLLKPKYCIRNDHDMADSVVKVNGWLESQKGISPLVLSLNKANPVELEPGKMFKKKVPGQKTVKNEPTKLLVKNNNNGEVYKPSELAEEYYNNFVERVRLKESKARMDIWSKAEQKMKEIEAKRVQEAARGESAAEAEGEGDTQSLEIVSLPQHRHLLTGECIVCKVMTERGYIA